MPDENSTDYDVFLSHNSEDKAIVRPIADYLVDNVGLKPWYDEWDLVPGEQWIPSLKKGLQSSKAVAVFVGKNGAGNWEDNEVALALIIQAKKRGVRIIPVILPDAPKDIELLPFLELFTWVDLRGGLADDDAVWKLECGIRGVPPGRGRPKAGPSTKADAPAAEPVFSGVPNVPHLFTGRDDDRARVIEAVEKGGVVVLHGMGGVGKTALAASTAHTLKSKFPGGIVWVSCETAPPFGGILLSIATALLGEYVRQETTEQHAAALRKHLETAPSLIVLDNFESVVADEELAMWLRTISESSAVLVTSRERVPNLPVSHLLLEALLPDFAVEFFATKAKTAGAVEVDGGASRELCEMVGFLPLAIELLAARAGEVSLKRLKVELSDSLGAIAAEGAHGLPGRHASINACIRMSYDRLSDTAKTLLGALSLLADGAGEAIIESYTGIADWSRPIGESVRKSLMTFDGVRYKMHPLVRRFMDHGLAEKQSLQRHLVSFAVQFARDNRDINDVEQRARFDSEWRNILIAVTVADEIGDCLAVNLISESASHFLLLRGLWSDRERVNLQAVAAAKKYENRQLSARALNGLGITYEVQGRLAESEKCFLQSLAIVRELDDRNGEGTALNNLGLVYKVHGLWTEAEDCFRQSIEILEELGDRDGAGRALNNLGSLLSDQDRWSEAEEYFRQSLIIKRESGDRIGEGQTLNNLGLVYDSQNRSEEAEGCYQQSLEIKREFGDRIGEGRTLNNLGIVYESLGRWTDAEECYRQDLEICREFGDRIGEGQTLENLALLKEAQGETAAALSLELEALEVLMATEHRRAVDKARGFIAKWQDELACTEVVE